MRSTLSLIRREFTAYFWSPVAYVVLGVFLLGLGVIFGFILLPKLTAPLLAGLVVLAVGLIWAVVRLGITAFVLVVVGAVAALAGAWGHYVADAPPHVFEVTAGIDPMPVVTSYLGLALAGAMFLALGLWVSSLVRNQLVAALVALALSLVFILGGLLVLGGFVPTPSDTGVFGYRLLAFLSVPLHFSRDFTRGLVDTRHVVLYVSVTLAGLFLT